MMMLPTSHLLVLLNAVLLFALVAWTVPGETWRTDCLSLMVLTLMIRQSKLRKVLWVQSLQDMEFAQMTELPQSILTIERKVPETALRGI